MDELKLRGYVSPEDFSGSDTEKLQQALNTAAEKDIGKVIVTGKYTVEKTLLFPEQMHLVLENAEITAAGDFPLLVNTALTGKQPAWSFEEKFFCITGENAVLGGDVLFFNADKVTVENVEISGELTFDFARSIRVAQVKCAGVRLCRGCNNAILQQVDAPVLTMDTAETPRPYVIGKEPDIHEIICNDMANTAVYLDATENEVIFNIQITGAASVEVSRKAGSLPRESYFNIIGEALGAPAVSHSDTKHCIL